ncbi:hypothetical protein FJZ21_03150 [Candidatus Pacearchaeota archaeon]|nr:hypothetical protein [Candidatus Pacearchaeota archaeon]
MFKTTSLFVLSLLVLSISFVSAQWVETPVFVEVTSAQAGSAVEGCAVASFSGMLASLGSPKIGSNPDPIIKELQSKLCPPDQWPPQSYDMLAAVLHFLIGVL